MATMTYPPSSGSGAPTDATYVTQTANVSLSNEQDMASLATGIVKNTTTTGVQSIAAQGTDYYAPGGTDVAVADGGTGASTAAAAATNLGLGTGDSPQFTGINVGHASDTTITKSSSGIIAVEGVAVPTISSSDSLSNKTLTTPTIASFTNATHSHTNAAGGGTLAAGAVPNLSLSSQALSNPYKFHAYRNAAQNTGNGAFAIINFDTELFDTNNNFDVTTNVGRYTAPVAGFYQFNARFSSAAGTNTIIALYKNGSIFQRGGHSTGSGTNGPTISTLVQSAASDYWEIYSFAGGGALEVGSTGLYTYFSGFLVSHT